jgi:hypothetical protein
VSQLHWKQCHTHKVLATCMCACVQYLMIAISFVPSKIDGVHQISWCPQPRTRKGCTCQNCKCQVQNYKMHKPGSDFCINAQHMQKATIACIQLAHPHTLLHQLCKVLVFEVSALCVYFDRTSSSIYHTQRPATANINALQQLHSLLCRAACGFQWQLCWYGGSYLGLLTYLSRC